MREYYTVETFMQFPKSRRVKQPYWDWMEGTRYETLEEALEEYNNSDGKRRIVKHSEEVIRTDDTVA